MVSDLDIQHRTAVALERSAEVPSDRIGVSVEDGVVTLAGNVSSMEKEAAEQIARSVEGVREVTNELQVVVAEEADLQKEALALAT